MTWKRRIGAGEEDRGGGGEGGGKSKEQVLPRTRRFDRCVCVYVFVVFFWETSTCS